MARHDIEARVRRVAEQALAEQHYIRPVDVLLGLGWLAPTHVDEWRQGRVAYLEGVTQGNPSKISTAMAEFRRWARARGLQPSETAYVARTRDRRPLRFPRATIRASSRRIARTGSRPNASVSDSPSGRVVLRTCL
jgi:hypothetical protein